MVYFRPALDGKMEGDGNAKLMIYTLERAIRLMPRGTWQYTIVIDCKGKIPPGFAVHRKALFYVDCCCAFPWRFAFGFGLPFVACTPRCANVLSLLT